MCNIFFVILKRDIKLYIRNSSEFFSVFVFFMLINSIFFFVLDDNCVLKKSGISIIWVNILLSIILSLDSLFKTDYDNGVLEQLIFSYYSLYVLILIKIFALWVSIVFPIIIIAPILGFLFGFSFYECLILLISLLIGTPTLTIIGVIGVILTIFLYRGGILLMILILPFYVPILIFGISSLLFYIDTGVPYGHFSILLALFLFTFMFGPFVISSLLKAGCSL